MLKYIRSIKEAHRYLTPMIWAGIKCFKIWGKNVALSLVLFIFEKVFLLYNEINCTALRKLMQFDCPGFSLSGDRKANSSFGREKNLFAKKKLLFLTIFFWGQKMLSFFNCGFLKMKFCVLLLNHHCFIRGPGPFSKSKTTRKY